MNGSGNIIQKFIHWLLTPWLLPNRPLTGKMLLAGQAIAAAIAAACAVMFVIVLPARYTWLEQLAEQGHAVLRLNTSLNPLIANLFTEYFPQAAMFVEVSVMALYLLNAALLFWKRSGDWLALVTAAALPSFALHIIPTMMTWMELSPFNTLVGSIFKCVGLGLAFLFLYLFPNGFYAPPWMRLFFWAWVVWAALWIAFPQSVLAFRDPYTIGITGFILLMIWWAFGIFSQIYRYYRVSGPLERQQTKTITFGAIVTFIGYFVYVPLRQAMLLMPKPMAASIVFEMIAPYIYLLMIGSIPILITVSILRYRLWDIDIIIRRTLVYSTLTGLLSVLYIGGVALLQSVVTVNYGPLAAKNGQPSAVVIVITTLAIGALFNPLRGRIQNFIDRRFYRQKYDAENALAKFAEAARNETDLELLTAELVRVVQESLQPDAVSLWTTPLDTKMTPPRASGEPES